MSFHFQAILLRLQALRLTVSHTTLYKKMDEFGSGHDQSILDAVSAESQRLAKEHQCKSTADNKPGEGDKESEDQDLRGGKTKCVPRFPNFEKFAAEESIENDDFILKMNKRLLHAKMTHAASKLQLEALAQKETISPDHARIVHEELAQVVTPPDGGRKIVFDNLDLHIEPHEMTEENQSKDIHWVSVMCAKNRILGNHLSTVVPNTDSILKMENTLCLPTAKDQRLQRRNYIQLVARLAVTHIDCLIPFQPVAVQHIHHEYSKEATKPTDSVSCFFLLTTFNIIFHQFSSLPMSSLICF